MLEMGFSGAIAHFRGIIDDIGRGTAVLTKDRGRDSRSHSKN